MSNVNELLKKIPKVDEILKFFEKSYNRDILKYTLNRLLDQLRDRIKRDGNLDFSIDSIVEDLKRSYEDFSHGSLKRVINATGVVVHTNLGRSPISEEIFLSVKDIICRYSNLEFVLDSGERGDRYFHSVEYLKLLTGAEDAVVVNNNAAAVFIILNTFGKGREVLVSRGELIEIGGSFRLPEVMKESGAILREVGTTNRTKIKDYESSITENSSVIMKSHTSNYKIIGFTESVPIDDIAHLAKKYSLISYYDAGSGVISDKMNICGEDTILNAVKSGIDLVSFSGDKLLGGPQCGVIVGKKRLIEMIKKNHLLRMLRVDKITLSILQKTLLYYLLDITKIKLYKIFNTDIKNLEKKAQSLREKLLNNGILDSDILVLKSKGFIGGGACPEDGIDSLAVGIVLNEYCEKVSRILRSRPIPVICRAEKGALLFDMLTVFDDEIDYLSESIAYALGEIR